MKAQKAKKKAQEPTVGGRSKTQAQTAKMTAQEAKMKAQKAKMKPTRPHKTTRTTTEGLQDVGLGYCPSIGRSGVSLCGGLQGVAPRVR